MNEPQFPPNYRVFQLCLSFANINVIYTLVKSGVIEQMRDSARTLEQIASAGKYDPDVLFRLLRYAAAIDLVSLSGNQYSVTETGKFLLKDVPGSVYFGIMLFGCDAWHRSWNNLQYSLETGDEAFQYSMGESFFDYLNQHRDYGEIFDKWMTIQTTMASKAIIEVYDFTPYKTICDVGGGQGILLKYILENNTHLKGILFDRENAVRKHMLADVSGRVEIKSGDFFKTVPSSDVLIMKNIIHNWDDKKALKILKVCKKAMKPNSRLLIVDRVIDNTSDLIGLFYDLHMQVLNAGRERTENEFKQLFENVGLKFNRIIPTKSHVKIIETTL